MKPQRDKAEQKAIVCAYLRYRSARKYRQLMFARTEAPNGIRYYANGIYDEAENSLESLKRVLWHNNWH